jgi:hypothetical protein
MKGKLPQHIHLELKLMAGLGATRRDETTRRTTNDERRAAIDETARGERRAANDERASLGTRELENAT